MNSNTPENTEPIVKGANLWQHFNVRCPGCNKLYRVDSKEISSSSPHFDCATCDTKFTFDFPPQNLSKIETRRIMATAETKNSNQENHNLKTCPKCGASNPMLNSECGRCQVIFEKVEDLPMDAKAKAFPSLIKAWQDIFSDYGNLKKHLAFVDRCEDLQALPFALKKYQTLKEAQPHDVLAQRMLNAVTMKSSAMQRVHAKLLKTGIINIGVAWATRIPWQRLRKAAPILLSAGFILYGLTHAGARNLIGIGVAVLFLTIGLTIFIKGRISTHDFW